MLLVCGTDEAAERLMRMFPEFNVPIARRASLDPVGDGPWPVTVLTGRPSAGFSWQDLGLVMITDEEIFGSKVHRPRAAGSKIAPFLSSFKELKPGDYVVHADYGVGEYQGLSHISVDGFETDFLALRYEPDAKLYVPLYSLDTVQKYIGSEGAQPKVDKLGAPTWARTKVAGEEGHPRHGAGTNYLSIGNQINLFILSIEKVILALTMAFLIINGEIDLSAPSIMGLSACIAAFLFSQGMDLGVALLISMSVGLACGLFNGVWIAIVGLNSLVVTLAMLICYRGLARVFLEDRSISKFPAWFNFLGQKNLVGPFPVALIIFFVLLVFALIILQYSGFGRTVFVSVITSK